MMLVKFNVPSKKQSRVITFQRTYKEQILHQCVK